MRDRKRGDRAPGSLNPTGSDARRRRRFATFEPLEGRELLAASLAPIPAATVPADLGLPVPLDGSGGTGDQTYTATSTNPAIKAQIANGPFLTIDVSHNSSGPNDPAFNGSMTFELFSDLTPTTVNRILTLVNQGFYTSPTQNPSSSFTNLPSKNFHRVASGFPGSAFIVQGGSVNGDGTGNVNQPGFPFSDEFVQQLAFTGTGQLAMANAGDDTNSSQFFITTGSPDFLNFQHTIFGQLVAGNDILQQMTKVSRDSLDAPVSPILITGTHVSPTSPDGTLIIDATAAGAGQTGSVTVTATGADGTTATQTFNVDVAANTTNSRPFLGPIGDQTTQPGTPVTFQLSAVSTDPGDTLTFGVGGGVASDGSFAPVQNGTATVDSSGKVTVTPAAGYTGPIKLLVGVRDQVNRATNLSDVANYDTQMITVNVTTNNPPTATAVTSNATQGQPVTIQLAGTSGDPSSSQTITYNLLTMPAHGAITNFDANAGTLTYTPSADFTGADTFTYGVTDVGAPTPNLSSSPATVTVNVAQGAPTNMAPRAIPQVVNAFVNLPTTVQLTGDNGDPNSGQTLTYAIDTSKTQGTISNFDANTGTFTYTPPTDFVGSDSLSFTVTDVGPPTPNLTSAPATVSFSITGAVDTGAVRLINNVLLITPPPGPLLNPPPNFIYVDLVGTDVVVLVNGQLDQLRVPITQAERVVVFGAKASDTIIVNPKVPLLTTLDGGHGGRNQMISNDLPSRLHGWFGYNTLHGGNSNDSLIGRAGHVRFVQSGGIDTYFAGEPSYLPRSRGSLSDQGVPPTGNFFRAFAGNVFPLETPPPNAHGLIVRNPPPIGTLGTTVTGLGTGAAAGTGSTTTGSTTGGTTGSGTAAQARAARIAQIQARRAAKKG